MRQQNSEVPVDDGDVRPASGLFALKGRTPAARPRLAWRPWLRGFAVGAIVFGTICTAAALLWAWHEWKDTVRASVPPPVYPKEPK